MQCLNWGSTVQILVHFPGFDARQLAYKEGSLGEVRMFRFWCIFLAAAKLLHSASRGHWWGSNVQILVHFPGCHWVRFDCSKILVHSPGSRKATWLSKVGSLVEVKLFRFKKVTFPAFRHATSLCKEGSLGEARLFRFWHIFLAATRLLQFAGGSAGWGECFNLGVFSWLPLCYFTLQGGVAGQVRMFRFWCIFLASARLLDNKEGSLGEVQLFWFWCIFLASAVLFHSARRGHWVRFECSDFGAFSRLPFNEVRLFKILVHFPGFRNATWLQGGITGWGSTVQILVDFPGLRRATSLCEESLGEVRVFRFWCIFQAAI